MKIFSADYIFPVSNPPIKNGSVIIDDDGKVLDILHPSTNYELPTISYKGIICPGFVNAHCHLELSYLKNKIRQKTGLAEFVKYIEQNRKADEEEVQEAIIDAENEMLRNGIVAVGDISNGVSSFAQKAKRKLKYHTFIEALGFHPDKAEIAFEHCLGLYQQLTAGNLPCSITPHAPYSVSEKLFGKIRAFAEKNDSVLSMHNQETEDEDLFFLKKEGQFVELFKTLGIDISSWKATGKTSLQSVLPFFPKENKLQLVHNTFTAKEEIANCKLQIAISQIYWCFCPHANLYIEDRLPDFKMFAGNDCQITIGTDSLASNKQLSVLEELKIISQNALQIPLEKLLSWATLNGAAFLGFEKELGSIEPGKKPGLNLIENIDIHELKLLPESSVKRLA